LAAEKKLLWEARSCGTAAQRYFEVPTEIRDILAREGVVEFTHIPQPVSRDLLRWADVALTLTVEQRAVVLDRFPEFRGKVRVLRTEAGLPDPDVADPLGREPEAYRGSARRIKEALARLVPPEASV
jgi:protein-tyrosine-phosphatase